MMWVIAGCVAPPGATDTGGDFVVFTPGPEIVVQPSADGQSHPTLARADTGWLIAWDEDGARQRADARWLDPEGAPVDDVVTLQLTGGAGFTTPDVVIGPDDDWYVVLRIGLEVEVARYRGTTLIDGRVAGTGELGFWTAPDLAQVGGELVVCWWDGDLADGAPATYTAARLTSDLVPVAAPANVAGSPDTGSPVAVEAHPDGWVMSWSDRDAIWVLLADPAGAVIAEGRVDDLPLAWPPTRPALAVADDGRVVVGWRAQDDEQRGYGTRLRWLDAGLRPVGPSFGLGLQPSSTNRIELDADGDWLAAVWEESTAEGDVVLQLFDLRDGEPLTGPMRVHDSPAGHQARPTVEVVARPDGPEVGVAFETGPSGAPPQVGFRRYVTSGR